MALLVPAPLDREVDGLRRALGDTSLGRIPAHLTLVPPVNVRAKDRAGALEVLRAAGGATRAFIIELGPAASFGPDSTAGGGAGIPATSEEAGVGAPAGTAQPPGSTVVYLAVGAGAADVSALRDLIRRGPLERRVGWPYVAHVTLADGASTARVDAAVTALADWRASVSFERVHLLEEGPGRVWEPVAEVALGAPAVVGRGGLAVELAMTERADRQVAAWAAGVAAGAAAGLAETGGATSLAEDAASGGFAVTARREGRVVGLAEGRITGGDCHLGRLVVGPAHRGQGVGSQLLAAVESLAAARGCERGRSLAGVGSRGEAFLVGRGWVRTGVLTDWIGGEDYTRLDRRLRS